MLVRALRHTFEKFNKNNEEAGTGTELEQASKLIDDGFYEAAKNLLDDCKPVGREVVRHHELISSLHSKLGDFESALSSLAKAAQASPESPWNWRLSRTPIRELGLKDSELDNFWMSCMGPRDKIFASAKKHLLNGRASLASETLRLSSGANLTENSLVSLDSIFKTLVSSDSSIQPQKETPKKQIVFLSGTGWSGTSAIFDYLLEFENTTGISTEVPFFARGTSTLLEVKRVLANQHQTREIFIDFVFDQLIGYGHMNNLVMTNFMFARKSLWNQKNQGAHFKKVDELVKLANPLWSANDEALKHSMLGELAEKLLEVFIVGRSIRNDEIILMRNAIPANAIEGVTIFKSSKSILCHRDPRSIYATLKRDEAVWFTRTPEAWSRSFSKMLIELRKTITELSSNHPEHEILEVQFEEFVLSPRLRAEIQNELHLNQVNWRRHSRFRPWESAKNVLIHEAHIPESEILAIHNRFPQYCFEIELFQDRAN